MDLDEFIASAAPRTTTVKVCGRGDLAAKHYDLIAEAQRIAADPKVKSLGADPRARELADEIDQVEAEMEAFTQEFTVKAVSRNAWVDLLAAHPPTKDEREQDETVHVRTFAVGALVACSHEPKISDEQARRLADTLPTGEWQKLWGAILVLNTAPTTAPKMGAATAILRANDVSSTTSGQEASPAPSSMASSGDPSPSSSTTVTV